MVEIRMEKIVKTYRKTAALDGVTLTLKPGTMTVVLGPSGCGKTTLLRILSGLLTADSGRVFFGENDVTALPPQERGAALVFQNYALWPHMSVFDKGCCSTATSFCRLSITSRKIRSCTAL